MDDYTRFGQTTQSCHACIGDIAEHKLLGCEDEMSQENEMRSKNMSDGRRGKA